MSREKGSFVTTEKNKLGDILNEAGDLIRTMEDYPSLRYGDAYFDHYDRILRNVVAQFEVTE